MKCKKCDKKHYSKGYCYNHYLNFYRSSKTRQRNYINRIPTLEELLSSAEQPDDDIELSEAERYVISRGLKNGNRPVLLSKLYSDYVAWSKKTPVKFKKFTEQIKQVLKFKKFGTTTKFYIAGEDHIVEMISGKHHYGETKEDTEEEE